MNKYELLVVLSAQVDDAANAALLDKVKGILESKGIKIRYLEDPSIQE